MELHGIWAWSLLTRDTGCHDVVYPKVFASTVIYCRRDTYVYCLCDFTGAVSIHTIIFVVVSTFVVTAFIQGRLLQIIAAAPFYILMMPLFIVRRCHVHLAKVNVITFVMVRRYSFQFTGEMLCVICPLVLERAHANAFLPPILATATQMMFHGEIGLAAPMRCLLMSPPKTAGFEVSGLCSSLYVSQNC